jgi:hypothetical protein
MIQKFSGVEDVVIGAERAYAYVRRSPRPTLSPMYTFPASLRELVFGKCTLRIMKLHEVGHTIR